MAVFAVMLSHWIHLDFVTKLGLGFLGVNVFFVLSGFLITEILLKQVYREVKSGKILRQFYLKRTLRIFPIYYLLITVATIYNWDDARNLAPYTYTYTLNIYNGFTGDIGNTLSHIWSLCVEEQFYLFWPLLILFVPASRHLSLILLTIVAAVGFRFLLVAVDVPHFGTHNYRQTPMCMDALAVGGLLAYLKLNRREHLERILGLKWLPVAALLGYFAIVLFAAGMPYLNHTLPRLLIAVFSFYLIGQAIFGMKGRAGLVLEHPAIQYLGRISYGLYLYHMIISSVLQEPFNNWIRQMKPSIPDWLYFNPYIISFPFYLGLTIIVATLSYFLIENPLLELKSRLELKWNRNSNLRSSAAVV